MAKKKTTKSVREKAATRKRGTSRLPKRSVALGKVDPEYLLSLLRPNQWNLLAEAFDHIAIPSKQLEDGMAVKQFLQGFFGTGLFQFEYRAANSTPVEPAPHEPKPENGNGN